MDENEMETTIVYWSCVGIMENKMPTKKDVEFAACADVRT